MNIAKMMQQAQKMQQQMKEMQSEMANIEVTGEAGAGMVKVTMNGEYQVRQVCIEDSLWDEQDKSMIEDLVAAACNHAAQSISQQTKSKQKDMMSGLPLPPGFSL